MLNKYEVMKTDHKLCMLMVQKNHDTSYAQLILDELKSDSPDFNKLCNSVSDIQRLARSGNNGHTSYKEVHLSSVDGKGTFKGKCGNCSKVCGFKTKEYKKRKGELHCGHNNGNSEGNTNNGGSSKTCTFCGLKGHKEAGCFKKLRPGTRKRLQRTSQLGKAWSCCWHHSTWKSKELICQNFKMK